MKTKSKDPQTCPCGGDCRPANIYTCTYCGRVYCEDCVYEVGDCHDCGVKPDDDEDDDRA